VVTICPEQHTAGRNGPWTLRNGSSPRPSSSQPAQPEPALFDTVSRTLRDRSALAGEVRAQTAQVRASAATLIALPFLFTGLCALADRSVLSFLLATVPGAACLAVGAALQALALLWMHRTIAGVAR
jgi:tight adherence protein B